MKRQVFYSFCYDDDARRVQQIRNIGAFDSNNPVSPNEWERIKSSGRSAIEKWIDDNMKYRSCVIVLVGKNTAQREWVQYEIQKAWNEKKGLFGIYIHNIKDPVYGRSVMGENPFSQFHINGVPLSRYVKCYNPDTFNAYRDISLNIRKWVEDAIELRNYY